MRTWQSANRFLKTRRSTQITTTNRKPKQKEKSPRITIRGRRPTFRRTLALVSKAITHLGVSCESIPHLLRRSSALRTSIRLSHLHTSKRSKASWLRCDFERIASKAPAHELPARRWLSNRSKSSKALAKLAKTNCSQLAGKNPKPKIAVSRLVENSVEPSER